MKRWIRNWLGVTDYVNDSQDYLDLRVKAIEQFHNDILSKSNDLQSALQEIRQIRETVLDPKRQPIITRNVRQFQLLVEQEP